MQSLKGKTALITGASKGIGRATALRLAGDGVNIIACATSIDLLNILQKELSSLPVQNMVQKCNVGVFAECQSLIDEAIKRFKKIDILINNAGVGYADTVIDSQTQEVEKMVQTNILGTYYMTKAALPKMIEQKSGDIVNIGSVAGIKYSPGFAMYSASKFAVRAFSEGLRNEVQEHGIRVTLVHPGMVKTNFLDNLCKSGSPIPADQGELLEANDLATAIHFALSRPQNTAMNEFTLRPSWQER